MDVVLVFFGLGANAAACARQYCSQPVPHHTSGSAAADFTACWPLRSAPAFNELTIYGFVRRLTYRTKLAMTCAPNILYYSRARMVPKPLAHWFIAFWTTLYISAPTRTYTCTFNLPDMPEATISAAVCAFPTLNSPHILISAFFSTPFSLRHYLRM
jgi:hypothetical protein